MAEIGRWASRQLVVGMSLASHKKIKSFHYVYIAEYNKLNVRNGWKKKVFRLTDCPLLYCLTFQIANDLKISRNCLFPLLTRQSLASCSPIIRELIPGLLSCLSSILLVLSNGLSGNTSTVKDKV
ncbi:hypothetical protein TIFTF001_029436 [Ficus carica]|uniref:Uncharacterized protein n=1 Tax=Ficus carica TaxID=3494 RepID=A0AA88DW02_FICCA|nr:hypothetical protein TIFTF001_029436 [Ficus carica]